MNHSMKIWKTVIRIELKNQKSYWEISLNFMPG